MEEKLLRAEQDQLGSIYPSTGELSRYNYPKHLAFFKLGKKYRERACVAANRVGKTWGIGGYETTLHLTGLYPDWWEGRRFEDPVKWWAAGATSETTRDIVQATLAGPKNRLGFGLIPKDCLGKPTWKQGVQGLIDTIPIKHVSGGKSQLSFKSYNQGIDSFMGTAQHGVWADEEPPLDIFNECLIRTATTKGILIATFTPLKGMSDVVLSFLQKT